MLSTISDNVSDNEAVAALLGLGGQLKWVSLKQGTVLLDERRYNNAQLESWYQVRYDPTIHRWRAMQETHTSVDCAPFRYRIPKRAKAACEAHHLGHGWGR